MKPRRWFRFTLRTLFVVLTLFGVWLGVQVKWLRERHAFLQRAQGYSEWDDGLTNHAPGLLWIFGERGVCSIGAPPSDSATLERLFPEAVQLEILVCPTDRPRSTPPVAYVGRPFMQQEQPQY